MDTIALSNRYIELPAFLPDATVGVVKSLDSLDLYNTGVQGIVVNILHLMRNPGISVIKGIGGLHKFINWNGLILTDSGGFQVFSMIRENSRYGTVTKDGIIFKPSSREKINLTPEKCIQSQYFCNSDIIMSLDYCTHPDDSYQINKESVDNTINWAVKSKAEYKKLLEKHPREDKPLIFGIIQGGKDKKLREKCAEALIEIGFDGYGFGGWPLDKEGNLLTDILGYTAELMPDNLTKYAMGIGRPENIVICSKLGYDLFDCVVPTREARHGRLYLFNGDKGEINLETDNFYSNIFIKEEKYTRDERPILESCNCYTCKNYSRAYLHHLFKLEDCLSFRLATIHNIYFYNELMQLLKEKNR
ncbi:MAG TPA: tRNA guanosine(34) transglycosylase Tgt [bacterium]|nr:tRNA guanosine(34) transglycosylase Tgt [bacterium]